jgi:hypothetical protein
MLFMQQPSGWRAGVGSPACSQAPHPEAGSSY